MQDLAQPGFFMPQYVHPYMSTCVRVFLIQISLYEEDDKTGSRHGGYSLSRSAQRRQMHLYIQTVPRQ